MTLANKYLSSQQHARENAMKIQSTPIPADEKLAILKQDASVLLRSDNRKLSDAVCRAILILEASEAELKGRRYD
jgi:hypothetical protein